MEYSLQNTHIAQAQAMAEANKGIQAAGYQQNQPGGKLPQQLGHQGSSHEEDIAS